MTAAIFLATFAVLAAGRAPLLRIDRTGATLIVIAGVLAAFLAGLNSAIVAVSGAAALLVTRRVRPRKIYAAIDWDLLVLFAGLFVVVGAGERAGFDRRLLEWLRPLGVQTIAGLSATAAVLSNAVSNVPAVMLFTRIVPRLPEPDRAWLALAMSSTLAGNLTVLGSIANLIVIEGARRRGVNVSFTEYARVGMPVTAIHHPVRGSLAVVAGGGADRPYYTGSMRVVCALLIVALAGSTAEMQGQTRRAPARPRPAPPPPTPPQQEPAELTCPAPLGTGVTSHRSYCDVLTGRDPAEGILIKLPPHKGEVTLTFDLHNRHTYSEEQMKDPRTAFARYSAGVGVLTMDNTLVSRAAVENEFRKASDLIERIGGGAGPAGVKAVAPTGSESVRVVIPEAENQVSILGEKLTVDRADGSITYTAPGRPIAIVSNAMIEFRPAPPPRTPTAKPPVKKTTP